MHILKYIVSLFINTLHSASKKYQYANYFLITVNLNIQKNLSVVAKRLEMFNRSK